MKTCQSAPAPLDANTIFLQCRDQELRWAGSVKIETLLILKKVLSLSLNMYTGDQS